MSANTPGSVETHGTVEDDPVHPAHPQHPPVARRAERGAPHAPPAVRPAAADEPVDPSAPPAEHRRSWAWVWLLVLLALAVGAFFAYRHFRSSTATETAGPGGGSRGGRGGATPVVAVTARRGDLPLYLNGLGTVTPLNTVTVRTRVDGQIDSVNYTEGQFVHQGDLLAQIDPRPFQVQLQQAQGQLARDQAALANANAEYNRNLQAREAIAAQVLETSQSTVRQFEAAVQIDQGQINSAQLQITYSRVTSPISGRVGLRLVDVGNIVHASDSTGIAVITQLQPISVLFTLPQDDIVRVVRAMKGAGDQKGLEVEAYDRDLRNKLGAGTLEALDNQVDPTTGTVRLKATFANEEGILFPNQFVNARLLVETRKDAVLVPAAAIQRGPDSTFVYTVKQDTVDMRNVTVGPTEGDLTVIESGVEPGEVVVTDGVDKLQKGSKVAVRGGGATTRPGGAAGPAGSGRKGSRAAAAGATTRPENGSKPTTREVTPAHRQPDTAPADDSVPGGGQ